MKTRLDPRHIRRQKLIKLLFAWDFQKEPIDPAIGPITDHLDLIDQKIQKAAPEWPLVQIAKMDLAILRLATFEIAIDKKEPPKVIIDEAIELAKEFSSDTSPGFVNAVLGAILKDIANK